MSRLVRERKNALPESFTFQTRDRWLTIEGICLVKFLSSVAPLRHKGTGVWIRHAYAKEDAKGGVQHGLGT